MSDTIRRKFDHRTHKAFDTGWQTLTLCGRRGNWLNGQEPIDPGTGVVDCPECLEALITIVQHQPEPADQQPGDHEPEPERQQPEPADEQEGADEDEGAG